MQGNNNVLDTLVDLRKEVQCKSKEIEVIKAELSQERKQLSWKHILDNIEIIFCSLDWQKKRERLTWTVKKRLFLH